MLKHKQLPLILYSFVWIVCVAWFWLFVKGDALGYAVLAFFVFLPLAALGSSFLIGYDPRRTARKWLFPLLFGLLHMLADYGTFRTANNLAHAKINSPDFSLLLPGLLCSLVGLLLGHLTQTIKHRLAR